MSCLTPKYTSKRKCLLGNIRIPTGVAFTWNLLQIKFFLRSPIEPGSRKSAGFVWLPNLSLPTTPPPPFPKKSTFGFGCHALHYLSLAKSSFHFVASYPFAHPLPTIFIPASPYFRRHVLYGDDGGPGHLWCQQSHRLFNNSRTVISIFVIYFSWDLRWLPAMETGLCGCQKQPKIPLFIHKLDPQDPRWRIIYLIDLCDVFVCGWCWKENVHAQMKYP